LLKGWEGSPGFSTALMGPYKNKCLPTHSLSTLVAADSIRRARLMSLKMIYVSAAATLVLAVNGSPARSQGYPPSQRGTVTQNVAFTEISVAYGRPVARGRQLFGALVPWDAIWHPGADSATRIRFSRDVVVEGMPLPAGEYSLWLIPRETAPWTVIFSRAARVFHLPYPGASRDALRVDVTPEQASHMESFAIYFPMVLRDSAVMRLHWGTTALPIRIKASFSRGASNR
jgi:hypothetical protein